MSWKEVHVTGEIVMPRRNHAAALVGTHMVVYGGLTEKS
jgi:hypothetical protein